METRKLLEPRRRGACRESPKHVVALDLVASWNPRRKQPLAHIFNRWSELHQLGLTPVISRRTKVSAVVLGLVPCVFVCDLDRVLEGVIGRF